MFLLFILLSGWHTVDLNPLSDRQVVNNALILLDVSSLWLLVPLLSRCSWVIRNLIYRFGFCCLCFGNLGALTLCSPPETSVSIIKLNTLTHLEWEIEIEFYFSMHFCQNQLIINGWVNFWASQLILSMLVSIPLLCCFNYYNLVSFEIRYFDASWLIFPHQDCFGHSGFAVNPYDLPIAINSNSLERPLA